MKGRKGNRNHARKKWALPFGLLALAGLVNYMDAFGYSPVLPEMQKAWGMSFTQVGLFSGLFGLVGIFVAVLAGEFIKRVGYRIGITLALSVLGVGLVGVALADSYTGGIIAQTVSSVGYRVANVAINAAVILVAPPQISTTILGIANAFGSLGMTIGPGFAGGYLGGIFGWRTTWWFLAGVTFIVALLFGVLFRFRLGLSSDEDETSASVEVSFAKGVSVYKNRMVWGLITANFLINFSSMALMQFVPVAMGSKFNASAQTIGGTMALGGAIAIGLAMVPAVLADRLGTRKWVILAFVLPVIPLSLLLNTNDLDIYRVVVVVFRALIGSTPAVLYALPRQLLPPKDVPVAMGLYSLSGGAVAYVAPQLMGVFRDISGGFSLGWYITAGVTLAACVLVVRLKIK